MAENDNINLEITEAIVEAVSPTATVSKVGDTATITVTDKNGTSTASIKDGDKGDKGDQGDKGDKGDKGDTGNTGATGATPELSIGTVSTLGPSEPATADITGTAEQPVLSLGIPHGAKGDTGNTGAAAGFGTVSASVDANIGTPAVSVTASGPDTAKNIAFAFSNLKGAKGDTGATGNGIASIEETATSGAVRTYTITYTNGDTTTFDVTDGEVTNASLATILEDYAKTDGAYESMTVGNAEQLISSVTVNDKVPYNFRTSGGSIDIGNREVDKLVGGTVAWNQLVQASSTSVTVQNGHKYYANINGTKSIGASNGSAIAINNGTKDNVIDLTQMFGSTIADYIYTLETATAGAGVAWFKKLFPKDYYAYNAGQLMSVKTSAHQMVGFNAWDEQWELGTIATASGVDLESDSQIRAKNLVPVVPNAQYVTTYSMWMLGYDKDKNVIPFHVSSSISNNASYVSSGNTFTIPQNCYYIRFYLLGGYGTTYKNDICINLHWDGERDGDYEAYKKWTYPLDSDLELRGIPKLDASNNLYYDGDTYEDDGTVNRRYGIVDLGTLEWGKNTSANYFYATISGIKRSADWNTVAGGIICPKYMADTANNVAEAVSDKRMAVPPNADRLVIYDTAYTSSDATAFKTAMSGIYLVYELDTPTTETADPYQNPQIVDDFGTEEYVDERTVAIPVGHDTEYMNNLKAKLEMAPDSPDGDGDYIVRQTNGENSYVPLMKELPSLPSTDGTYTLKCTVASGTATLGWEREE